MAVKKPARSAAKPLAKKVAAKKTPAKKSASAKSATDPLKEIVAEICEGIKGGAFDSHIVAIDNALTERLNAQQSAAAKKTPAKKSPVADTKKVSSAPKRAAKVK